MLESFKMVSFTHFLFRMMAMEGEGRNTLHGLVEENLSQYEDKVAILYDTGDSKDFVTYKEMWSETSLVNIVRIKK